MTVDERPEPGHVLADRRALVAAVFEAVSRFDTAAVLALLHPDFALELPYEETVPQIDRAGFIELVKSLAEKFGQFRMNVAEAVECTDPDVVVLRYEGDCQSQDGTIAYRNSYVGFFYFTDNLVSQWREYTNPIVSRRMARDFDTASTSARDS
jgi:ketosteroid isomerase-like protein